MSTKKSTGKVSFCAAKSNRNAEVRLDSMAKAKEDAVANSQQMLEEDAKKFEDYLQVCLKLTGFLPNHNRYCFGFRDDVKNTI